MSSVTQERNVLMASRWDDTTVQHSNYSHFTLHSNVNIILMIFNATIPKIDIQQ